MGGNREMEMEPTAGQEAAINEAEVAQPLSCTGTLVQLPANKALTHLVRCNCPSCKQEVAAVIPTMAAAAYQHRQPVHMQCDGCGVRFTAFRPLIER